MSKKKETVERRKSKRFPAKSGAYVVFNPKSNLQGQIVDISVDGLAVLFAQKEEWFNKSLDLSILMNEDDLCLQNIPAEIVSSFAIASDMVSGSEDMQRCGVKFGELTSEQRLQLEHFIWLCTKGET